MSKARLSTNVFAATGNTRVPRGWVEIQRWDRPEPIYNSDSRAAHAVAEAGGSPYSAMLYDLSSDRFIQLLTGDESFPTSERGWIVIAVVPASVALAAGVISKEAARAREDGEQY